MPTAKIEGIELGQFRSYESCRLELGDRTFIVGRNAAGKTNLLDSLALLSEIASEPLRTVLDRRGGIAAVRRRAVGRGAPYEMSIEVDLSIGSRSCAYKVWIRAARGQEFRIFSEACILGDELIVSRNQNSIYKTVDRFEPKLTDETLMLPLIGGIKPFDQLVEALQGIRIYAIEPLRMKEPQVPDDGTGLRFDGSNAASVVRELRKTNTWDTIIEFLKAAVPQIDDVEVKREGAKLSLQFRQTHASGNTVLMPGYQSSDGTMRILGMLLALFQIPSPTLVALEEPEAHVHPGALGVVLDAIRFASARTQVVVTTQSPDLLDAKWIVAEDIRIVEWENGSSKVRKLSDGAVGVLRSHLRTPGELLKAGALE